MNLKDTNWNMLGSSTLLEEGHSLNKAKLLFSKVEDEAIQAQIDKLNKTKEAMNTLADAQGKEAKFEDFAKLEFKIGTILEAEPVEKTDKLLKLIVDTGDMKRNIVSGIAQEYSADEIVGKQVSVLTNLQPKKIRGILSQGMILMAEDEKGKLAFVSPDKAMGNGCTIR
ncbi:MAG: methionine--tRNA ligase subunit beta [Bacteroidia bacterium]|nr:methionine--tRNA ligase subunit beta [Bacteroidia bacterium]